MYISKAVTMSEAQEPLLGHIIYLAPKQFEKCVVPYITRKIEVRSVFFLYNQEAR